MNSDNESIPAFFCLIIRRNRSEIDLLFGNVIEMRHIKFNFWMEWVSYREMIHEA